MISRRPIRLRDSRWLARTASAEVAIAAKSSVSMPIGNSCARSVRPERMDQAVGQGVADPLAIQIVVEVAQIVAGLKAEQVVGAHRLHQLIVPRQGDVDLGRRERDVQEEADPALDAEPAQLLPHRDQVVVVHPDQIVVAQIRVELLGEQLVDLAVGDVPVAIEAREIEPVVEQRPERAVGEAAVVALEGSRREVDRDVGDVAGARDLGDRRGGIGLLAAPAEPDAAGLAQGGQDADRQPARGRGPAARDRRDAIGDDDEAAHRARQRRFKRHPPTSC